jgi:hypothetical protein
VCVLFVCVCLCVRACVRACVRVCGGCVCLCVVLNRGPAVSRMEDFAMLVHKLTEPAKQGDAATVRGKNFVPTRHSSMEITY